MRASLALAAALLPGCVVVPRTETVFDPACRIETKQMTLHVERFGYIGSCSGRECAAVLAALGAIAAGSMVVSGTIVVVGNVVYWAEKQGKCIEIFTQGKEIKCARLPAVALSV
jgi:hypothetical protein